MTFESSIPVCLLSNERLLQHLLASRMDGGEVAEAADEPFPVGNPYELYARWEFQHNTHWHSNEVFDSRWAYFQQRYLKGKEMGDSALAALQALCHEYLLLNHGRLHVKLERYGEWQNLMANINFHPIIAYAMQMEELGGCLIPPGISDDENYRAWGNCLCYPYAIAVEDYIRREGLNDAHLHINACAYAEASWLQAVCNPGASYGKVLEGGKATPLRQQFLEVYGARPTTTLREHLQIAHNIRSILRLHVEYPPRCEEGSYTGAALGFALHGCGTGMTIRDLADIELPPPEGQPNWEQGDFAAIVHRERAWMGELIHSLLTARHPGAVSWLSRLFHVYLLLMNEFCNLLTMRETQKGFNQFDHTQGIPHALSWLPHYYYETFRHFHGLEADSIVHYLDARIAPKATVEANKEQLEPILRDYLHYLRQTADPAEGPPRTEPEEDASPSSLTKTIHAIRELAPLISNRYIKLNLTAHFIKLAWKEWDENSLYRHQSYRVQLAGLYRTLHDTLCAYPEAGDFLRAVDAANDEQNIPPSVLAPCFRDCRRHLNMEHITFHCGEDFPHLLTGLRVLDDAVTCLDLHEGDRVGHATALGIHPRYWLDHSPRVLCVRKEDRMLDLLLALRVLKHDPDVPPHVINGIQDELMEHAHGIFGSSVPSFDIYELNAAMRLRKLDPARLISFFGPDRHMLPARIAAFTRNPEGYRPSAPIEYDPDPSEHEMMKKLLLTTPPKGIEMLMAWFTARDVWERGRPFEQVELKRQHVPFYIKLQQHIMRRFRKRGIVIETLITSNLRIASYRHATEHHAMRWMQCPPSAVEGDPKVLLAFGSDDPGIFSCDAKAEFYLLYSNLLDHNITEQEALRYLHEINKRGSIYSFSNTNCPRAL